VQVEAPFIFRAAEAPALPEPTAIADLKLLEPSSKFDALLATNIVSPPAEPVVVAEKAKKRRGFLARLGGLFAAMFAGK
jgi:hypothetical protein